MNQRIRITIRGAVQGVGFRPFIYRLAAEMQLPGWITNSAQGVSIEVEGIKEKLDAFLLRIEREKPPRSFLQSLEVSFLDPAGYENFEIRQSVSEGENTAFVLPDISTCPDCLMEIFDEENRRYLYPFTNCTNCGPRFTIIESLPYDRPNTTMKAFQMCDDCRREYRNPLDRRFHAQPNACPACGPHLELWNGQGDAVSKHGEALLQAADAIRKGEIVALKGLGGFQLLVDAGNEIAVARLRERKQREEKPFALMCPSVTSARELCGISELELRLLLSPESPIVLLQRTSENGIARSVAPGNPYLGIMLPYTPLHHILMRELGIPIVATSGNISDEPICIDEYEALVRLEGIADLFLVHDRPILRHVDDSVVRILLGREMVIRRARGYAPLPVQMKTTAPRLLAVGGHLKNTVALTAGHGAFLSQHIGDLETSESYRAFQDVIRSFLSLYQVKPDHVVCDMHPEYLSTKYAKSAGTPVMGIQHHYAHVASCMAENELEGPVLGVSWDGTGYGEDHTIWGGEFLLVEGHSFRRVASLRTFRLPGGSMAIKEPRRTAIGLLYEIFGDGLFDIDWLSLLHAFTGSEQAVLRQMLSRGTNSPLTSSAGRLFDGVACLLGLRRKNSFEGQAAMELEFAAKNAGVAATYPFTVRETAEPMRLDWDPMIREILSDVANGIPAGISAAKFHNTLAEMIVAVAQRTGCERIVLSGGCFQNVYLTEETVHRLRREGFRPYWHQRVPPNDGGIALGQIFAAAKMLQAKPKMEKSSV